MNPQPIGGTFVLNVGSRRTPPLSYDASHQEIDAAMEAVYRARREGIRLAKTLRKRHNAQKRMRAAQMWQASRLVQTLMDSIDARFAAVGIHALTKKEWNNVLAQMSKEEKIAYYRVEIWQYESMLNDTEFPLDKASRAHYSQEVARYTAQIAELETATI